MVRRLALAALLPWMVAGVASCSTDTVPPASAPVNDGSSTTTSTTTGDGPLSLSITRSRLFGSGRQFYLTFRSTDGSDVRVTSVQLRSALYSSVEPSKDGVLASRSGDPISIPLSYGAAACGGAPSPELFVRIVADGRSSEVALGDAPPAIMREHELECARNRVRRQVDLGFGPDWRTVGAGQVAGTLTLDRRSGSKVALEKVATSVVFTVEVTSPLPATDDVDVVVTAARCDAHALTESKKTFTFFFTFTDGGGEPILVEVPLGPGSAHRALDQAIKACVASREGG